MKPSEIRSNCVAKRAFEVAAVGNHDVLLIGPLGTSKTTLRTAFPDVRSAEMESCLCGHYQDPTRDCRCSPQQMSRWMRRVERFARNFEIVIEACATPVKEMMSTRKPDPYEDQLMDARIAAAKEFGKTHASIELVDDLVRRTVEMAARRLSLTNGQYNNMLSVARSIANLDASDTLKAKHVAEACLYGSLLRNYQA